MDNDLNTILGHADDKKGSSVDTSSHGNTPSTKPPYPLKTKKNPVQLTVKLVSQEGLDDNYSGSFTATVIENHAPSNQEPAWKDYQVLWGAIKHELYLTPPEYALVQGLKRNVLSCYRNKQEKKPGLSSVGEKEQEYQALKPDVTPESLNITQELIYKFFGTPEELEYWTNKAIEKNKISRSKVLAKWPALESEQSEPVLSIEQVIYSLAQILEPVLRKQTAETKKLELRHAQEIAEKDRAIKELTYQRDHFMDVIRKGPDPMNYFGTNKLLVQTIKELVDKQNLKH